jgi:tetratricopeptide (TPR) repeat protein
MKRGWGTVVVGGSLVLIGLAGHGLSAEVAERTVWPTPNAAGTVSRPTWVAPETGSDPSARTGGKSFSLPRLPWSGSASKSSRVSADAAPPKKTTAAEQSKLEGRISIARLAERRGQIAQAEEVYREVAAKHPDHPVPPHRLGVLTARRGKYEEANQFFQTAVRLAPRNVELLTDAGYCYYLQNRYDDAEQLYRQALAIDPSHEALCNNIGLMLAEQGRSDDSLQMFRRATTAAQAHANLAFMMAQTGDLQQAESHFNRALTLDPTQRRAAQGLLQLAELKQQANLAALSAQREAPASPPPAAVPARAVLAGPLREVAADSTRNIAVSPPAAVQVAPAKTIRLTSQEEIVDLPPVAKVPADTRAANTAAAQAQRQELEPAVVPAVDVSPRRRRIEEGGADAARVVPDRTARGATPAGKAAIASPPERPDGPRAVTNKRLTDRDEPATKPTAPVSPRSPGATQGVGALPLPSGTGMMNLNPHAQARPLGAPERALSNSFRDGAGAGPPNNSSFGPLSSDAWGSRAGQLPR